MPAVSLPPCPLWFPTEHDYVSQCYKDNITCLKCFTWWPPRSGLSLDAIGRVYLDSTGSGLHLLSMLARVTGRDTGYGLSPSCHHVLGTSVNKHPVVDIDMSHSHLSWGQNVCSCLTESLKTHFKLVLDETVQFYLRDTRHGIHAIGRVRSLRAGRGGGNS